MSTPVITELLNGSRFRFDGGAGYTNRIFTVEGLSVSNLNNPSSIYSLIGSLGNLPQYTQAHDTLRNMYCSGVEAQPWPEEVTSVSKSGLKLIYDYCTPSMSRPLGTWCAELTGSNGQIIKNRWEFSPIHNVSGKPIVVGYNPDGATSFPDAIDPTTIIPQNPNGNRYDTFEFPRETPNYILTLARTSNSATADDVVKNNVNTSTWLGFDPYTVFCRDVQATQVFGCSWYRDHFIQRFVFEIAPDESYWEDIGFFLDEHTGKPVICDITDGTNNGYVKVDRPDTDFGVLSVPTTVLFGS